MAKYLIIGGSKGIGKQIAIEQAEEGNELLICSRSEPGWQHDAVSWKKWDSTAGEDLPFSPDLLDGLVYAPGSISLKPFHRIKEDQFQEDFNLNVMGAVRAIQSQIKALKSADHASVVMFSTVAVQQGMPFHSSIAMAKAAIEGLTRSLAAEYANIGIRFNAIAPSVTDTDLAKHLLSDDKRKDASNKRHPLGRYGQVEDLSKLARYLLSSDSSWMSGQILHLDGGLSSLRLIG